MLLCFHVFLIIEGHNLQSSFNVSDDPCELVCLVSLAGGGCSVSTDGCWPAVPRSDGGDGGGDGGRYFTREHILYLILPPLGSRQSLITPR